MRLPTLLLAFILITSLPGACADAPQPAGPQIQNAHWIWLKGYEEKPNASVYVRKSFILEEAPQSATLQIAADNDYEVWLNGSFVGSTKKRGEYAWRNGDIYSISALVREGENYIAIKGTNHTGQGAVIATLLTDHGSGRTGRVNTDSSWQAASNPGEDWERGATSAGDWQRCLDYGQAATTAPWFAPRTPTRVTELIDQLRLPLESAIVSPVSAKLEPETTAAVSGFKASGSRIGGMEIAATAPGQKVVFTCDMGKEMVGFPIVHGFTQGSAKISVACGEYEAECAKPNQAVITQQFELGGIRWTVPERRAFRYVRFTVEPAKTMKIDRIEFESVGRHTDPIGSFKCSDAVLNKIYNTSAYTVKLCMQDFYEDGIKRDRLLWTGDLRVEALVGYYCFGDIGLARRSLMQLADIQLPDGLIPGVGPDPNSTYLPDYCAYWVIALADYYRYSGDLSTVTLLYPTLQKLMQWFQTNSDETGLFAKADRPGWWMFVDWDESLEKKDRVMAMEALYHWALKDAASLARAVENPQDARTYTARAAKLKAAVNSLLWDAKRGAYVDCLTDEGPSEKLHKQPNSLAILAGLPDAGNVRSIVGNLLRPSRTPPVTTPYMNFYVASAFFEAGMAPHALDLVRKYWGSMIERGATTCWEKFDPEWPHPYEQADLSYCHGWSAGPGMMLPAYIAGVRPAKPGYDEARIEPELAGLEWVRAAVPTPNGQIKVDWKSQDGLPVGSIVLPPRCPARVVLPAPPAGMQWTIGGKVEEPVADGSKQSFALRSGRTHSIALDSAAAGSR